MNIGKSYLVFLLITIACMGILLHSCSDENEFTIGDDFVESSTHLAIVDTFSVEMSTVIQDSIPTSATGAMLVGNYQDTIFGSISCIGFCQIGLPASISLDENDIYDSIVMVLEYSEYFFGDTNNLVGISVHQLNESIELHDNGYLYNTSNLNFENNALGSVLFQPSPKSSEATVNIKISNAFGIDLYNKFVNKSEIISSENDFLDYFKGVAIVADESMNKTVLGFKAVEGSPYIRLYTHRIEQTEVTNSYDFPLIYEDYQFNQINFDFSNTLLQYTDNERTAIPSGISDNKAFVQGYQKIMTKLRFPTLPNILLNEKGIIMKAELVFYPEKTSYHDFALPGNVILYETDYTNEPTVLLYDDDNNVKKAEKVVDNEYNENTYYTFDITNFIIKEFSDLYFDIEHGLLISLYDESYQLNFERIVIEAENPVPKLRLYYLTY